MKRDTLVLLAFTLVAVIIGYLDRVNISVAILEMEQEFDISLQQKALLLSMFNVGYMIAQIPGGIAATRWGGEKVLLAVLVCCSALTLLTPLAAFYSIGGLLVIRVALGIAEGAMFPAMFMLYSKFVPVHNRSTAAGVAFSGVSGGTLLGFLLSGLIVGQFGWRYLFYFFGALGAFWVIAWAIHLRGGRYSKPVNQPDPQTKALPIKTPWGLLLRSSAVWAQIVSQFVISWTLYLIIAWLPSYLRDVQGLEVSKSGFYAAAPWLVMLISINVIAWGVDLIAKRYGNLTLIRKVVQTIGLIGGSGMLALTTYATTPAAATVLICILLFFMSFVTSGVTANFLELAPSHAGVLMGLANTAGQLAGFIGIASTGWIVASTGSYDSVFILAAVLNVVGAIIWIAYCSAEPITD